MIDDESLSLQRAAQRIGEFDFVLHQQNFHQDTSDQEGYIHSATTHSMMSDRAARPMRRSDQVMPTLPQHCDLDPAGESIDQQEVIAEFDGLRSHMSLSVEGEVVAVFRGRLSPVFQDASKPFDRSRVAVASDGATTDIVSFSIKIDLLSARHHGL